MSQAGNSNICSSTMITKNKNDFNSLQFPPIKKTYDDYYNNIIDTVLRCTTFSSKFINRCELSNKFFNDDDDYLRVKYLKGSQCISNHHCYGCVQYDKRREDLF